MDIYLREIRDKTIRFRFPSLPDGKISIKQSTVYQDYDIIGKGKLSFPAGMGKSPIKWKGYFWGEGKKDQGSLNRKWVAPESCIRRLSEWQKKGTPLNLVGAGLDINTDVTIQAFDYEPFGGSGDIRYEISFVPYVQIQVHTTAELGIEQEVPKKVVTRNDADDASQKTYEIKQGDNLWNIAKSNYGSGMKYTDIYNANRDILDAEASKYGRNDSDNGYWIYPGTIITLP